MVQMEVEQNEKELYLQQARLINETTKLDVARIENQANIVAQSAVAQVPPTLTSIYTWEVTAVRDVAGSSHY